MKEKDKLLFVEICISFILTRGTGINAKPPEDIMKYRLLALNPSALWDKCSMMVEIRIKNYCEVWDLPFEEWKAFLEGNKIKKKKVGRPKMSKQIEVDIKEEIKESDIIDPNCRCPDCRKAKKESKKELEKEHLTTATKVAVMGP